MLKNEKVPTRPPQREDYAENALAAMNAEREWPTTPVHRREDEEHLVNLPLGLAAWFRIKRLVWPDKQYPDNAKGHVISMDYFPWGRKVHVRTELASEGNDARIKIYVEDASGLTLLYEGVRGDEYDSRTH